MPRPTRQELPAKVDDWKAPWEVNDDGEDIPADDQNLDPASLKKLLFGLLGDKNRLRTQVSELTSSREELEQQIAEATDPKKIEELQAKVKKAEEERDAAKSGTALENLKLQIALEKGLTAKQVKRLVGGTREELEADADEILEEFGGKPPVEEEPPGGEGEGEERPKPRSIPRSARQAPTPPKEVEKLVDPDDFAKDYLARKAVGY